MRSAEINVRVLDGEHARELLVTYAWLHAEAAHHRDQNERRALRLGGKCNAIAQAIGLKLGGGPGNDLVPAVERLVAERNTFAWLHAEASYYVEQYEEAASRMDLVARNRESTELRRELELHQVETLAELEQRLLDSVPPWLDPRNVSADPERIRTWCEAALDLIKGKP